MLSNLQSAGNLSDSDFQLLTSKLESRTLKKNEHFLQEGTINKTMGYIEKGLAMYYRIVNGEEIPLDFGIEGQWISDLQSFNGQIPSTLNIKMLEESTLHCLSYQCMHELFAEQPRLMALKSYYVESYFADMAHHSANLATLDATQRYETLVKEKSYLINRVPQYYIAAYLGIKPESLSRIRKRQSGS
jgi:CRP/FNR family transcriptional regulator, anaerobic regulatory protein